MLGGAPKNGPRTAITGRKMTSTTADRDELSRVTEIVRASYPAMRGIARLEADRQRLQADLAANWEVLAEAVQTVMRRYRVEQPYEKLKELTRGQQIGRAELASFVDTLEIPAEAKTALKTLEPCTYIGNAPDQARAL